MKKKTLTLSLIASAFAFAAVAHANTIGVHGGIANFDLGDEDGVYLGVTNQSAGDRVIDNRLIEVDYASTDNIDLFRVTYLPVGVRHNVAEGIDLFAMGGLAVQSLKIAGYSDSDFGFGGDAGITYSPTDKVDLETKVRVFKYGDADDTAFDYSVSGFYKVNDTISAGLTFRTDFDGEANYAMVGVRYAK